MTQLAKGPRPGYGRPGFKSSLCYGWELLHCSCWVAASGTWPAGAPHAPRTAEENVYLVVKMCAQIREA